MSEQRPQRGFTLVELLVAIGIIALLASLLLVGLNRWRRQADISRMRMDFAAIATALDAYRADMGDYPRNHVLVEDPVNSYLFPSSCRLGDYLVAPAPQDDRRDASNNLLEFGDGADGPGFRTIRNTRTGGQATGRVVGPYLAADRFKIRRLLDANGQRRWVILDRWGTPIEYYPLRRSAGPAVPQAATGVTGVIGPLLGNSDAFKTLFDDREGELSHFNEDGSPAHSTASMRVEMNTSTWVVTSFPGPRRAMAVMLGDDDADNYIRATGNEQPRWQSPYVLISAGADGVFATDGWGTVNPARWLSTKSDDIYNFER